MTFYFQLHAKIFFIIFKDRVEMRLKNENLNIIDIILKILKLHEELKEKFK